MTTSSLKSSVDIHSPHDARPSVQETVRPNPTIKAICVPMPRPRADRNTPERSDLILPARTQRQRSGSLRREARHQSP